jgi:cytochrome d ubiquinol oxidase subunit II
MDGFDFGIAALVRVLGRDDDERRALLETVEAGVGRQPGLVRARRWRDVRGLSVAVRGGVLGFYLAMMVLLRGVHLRRSVSATGTSIRIHNGAMPGTGRSRFPAACRR